MTKIICRTNYKLALTNPDRIKIYNKNDTKYINSIVDYFSDDKKRMLSMIDYFTGKINKHDDCNLVLENGKYATKEEIDKRKKYINKQFEKSNVWQVVLSFDKKFIDNNVSWRELEVKLAKEILPKFFKKMGFEDVKKIKYCFSLHTNTKNPHFHISFMESLPNTKNKHNELRYRRYGKIDRSDINWLKNEVILSVEREKQFNPKATLINQDIENIKKQLDYKNSNFILYDKKNILLEDKILELGKLLEEKHISENKKIKFNSIKSNEIKILTKEIKDEIFSSNKELQLSKSCFNDSIKRMNDYFINIAKSNNIKSKSVDLSYTQKKQIYLDNYILNSIVNYARDNYKKKKIITSNSVFKSIVNKVYKDNKNITKHEIVRNSLSNNYRLTNQVRNAIKNINKEMEDASKEFENMFEKNNVEKNIEHKI